jgi:hypothetical protein
MSALAAVRLEGYRSIIRNRLVWRGDVKSTDIETQAEFAQRARFYGVSL